MGTVALSQEAFVGAFEEPTSLYRRLESVGLDYDRVSFRSITENFVYWDTIEVRYRDQAIRSSGHGFCDPVQQSDYHVPITTENWVQAGGAHGVEPL